MLSWRSSGASWAHRGERDEQGGGKERGGGEEGAEDGGGGGCEVQHGRILGERPRGCQWG